LLYKELRNKYESVPYLYNMKIIQKTEAIHIDKPEGTKIDYYLRDEYELHYNEQVPNSTQTWHHHEQILETLFIIEGSLLAKWKENEEIKEKVISKGDLVETENTPHTFTNNSDEIVKFIVIKQVLSGQNKQEIFKTDKVVDE
jgi:mannose-6-phosphate isomerase-like protein (cupin superfamily)